VADEKDLKKAVQNVFHDPDRRSYVLLPVIPVQAPQLTSTHDPRYVPKRPPAMAR
jgi:hypothetical protein